MDVLNMPENEVLALAVDEAIHRLALVNESARPSIITLVQESGAMHPRALCAAYRKDGEQLSHQQLQSAGLRANTFMSRRAFAEIAEAGLKRPLDAHSDTVLRAYFSFARWQSLWASALEPKDVDISIEAISFVYDMVSPCPACKILDGTKVMPLNVYILPPPDCECHTANYSVRTVTDWAYDVT